MIKTNLDLFMMKNCDIGGFIGEYTGIIISSEPKNGYSMKMKKGLKLWLDRLNGGQTKNINLSCSPNCKLEQWIFGCLLCM